MRRIVILHLFVPGSGEYALHNMMYHRRDVLRGLGLCYPGAVADLLYGTMSHRSLQEWLNAALMTKDEGTLRTLNQSIHASMKQMLAQMSPDLTPILSMRLPQFAGMERLLRAWKSLPELQSYVLRPVFSLTHQQDYVEFQARYTEWYQPPAVQGNIFLQTDYTDYAKSIALFYRLAKAHELSVLDQTVLWHTGEPGALDNAGVNDFFTACGSPLPTEQLVPLPYEGLRAYITLRFAALTLPHRASIFFRHLGMAEEVSMDSYLDSKMPELMRALHRAEEEGAVSLAPLSRADVRNMAGELSAAGNRALAAAYPHLASVILSSAHYAPHVPAVEAYALDAATVDTLLDFFTSEQRMAMRRRLQSLDVVLIPEQELILQRLESRAGTASHQPVPRRTPLVSVLTLTKNHRKFIAENMESVLAQQTDFPVQHLIVDDGSTDGTQDIIDDYACRHAGIKPVFIKTKAHNGDNVRLLFSLARTPFVALCDGDDYFTEVRKLQKQADLLLEHKEYSLCFHPVAVVHEDDGSRNYTYPALKNLPRGVRNFYYLADMFKSNVIQTNSVMYRWRFTKGLPQWFDPSLLPGDWYWHLLHAEMGKTGFLQDVMSVYRRHAASLYYSAEGYLVEHRLRYGMEELRSYMAINEHFCGKYEHMLVHFSDGVFAHFLQVYKETGDDTLLKKAIEAYPLFGKHFLSRLQNLHDGSSTEG